MTPLETQLAQLLLDWVQFQPHCHCVGYKGSCLRCRTCDALALYDRMAQEIAQERD